MWEAKRRWERVWEDVRRSEKVWNDGRGWERIGESVREWTIMKEYERVWKRMKEEMSVAIAWMQTPRLDARFSSLSLEIKRPTTRWETEENSSLSISIPLSQDSSGTHFFHFVSTLSAVHPTFFSCCCFRLVTLLFASLVLAFHNTDNKPVYFLIGSKERKKEIEK